MGFTLPSLLPVTRCALTAPFHPYLAMRGGIFSVALSVGSPLPRVTRHTALWSSDFPRPLNRGRDCLSGSGKLSIIQLGVRRLDAALQAGLGAAPHVSDTAAIWRIAESAPAPTLQPSAAASFIPVSRGLGGAGGAEAGLIRPSISRSLVSSVCGNVRGARV